MEQASLDKNEQLKNIKLPEAASSAIYHINRDRIMNSNYANALKEFESHGIILGDFDLTLMPIVDLEKLLIEAGLSGEFEHVGYMKSSDALHPSYYFDNSINLANYNVFGNPDPRFPTYIRPVELKTIPNNNTGKKCLIKINSAQLNNYLILADPEMYNLYNLERYSRYKNFYGGIFLHHFIATGEIPLGSFMIFGGIPKEAITNLTEL